LEHPDPIIEAMRQDLILIKSALLGTTDGSRMGLHSRVTSLESQWGKVYALMSLPVGALLVMAATNLFSGGKH
jgi:hypothetical protein